MLQSTTRSQLDRAPPPGARLRPATTLPARPPGRRSPDVHEPRGQARRPVTLAKAEPARRLAPRCSLRPSDSDATVESAAATPPTGRGRDPARSPRGTRRPPPRRDGRPAQALATAIGAGRANLAQGRVIIAALERLPGSGEFAVPRAACGRRVSLVALAAVHDAKALRVLGRRVFEVIAPDLAEQFDGRALEREEAEALRRTTLRCVRTTKAPATGGSASRSCTGRC